MNEITTEQKQRSIQVPKLFDHIMQHIIMKVLEPIIMKGMYKWNCGVIPRRGPIYAKRYTEKMVRKHKNKHALKLDIKKYFHNINTEILVKQLERKIKDRKFISFVKGMLDAANDDTGDGIPIGFYSSQWLSNFYLEAMDMHIKQTLRIKWYVRYMDDIVIVANSKEELHKIKRIIFSYMEQELKIRPNRKYQVYPIRSRHIDFVGYLIGEKKTKLRKRTFKIYMRRLRALGKKIDIFLCRSYMSLRGWLVHCNVGRMFLRKNEPSSLLRKIKDYISRKDKERLYEELCQSY